VRCAGARTRVANFDTLRVELADGRRLESPQDFDNTFGGALGAEYRWSERLTLRAGTQLDATPVSDDLRSTQQPDGDRLWAAAGFTYALRPGVSIDVSYAHGWVRSADIDRSDEFAPLVSSARTRASLDAHANVVGVQLNDRFEALRKTRAQRVSKRSWMRSGPFSGGLATHTAKDPGIGVGQAKATAAIPEFEAELERRLQQAGARP
jgi:hypothetical protein